MPEFYADRVCDYQPKAQLYLDVVARGVRDNASFREFLIKNTAFAERYARATPLWDEQWRRRDKSDSMKCAFWANYFCGRDGSCECRPPDTKALESDAIFFLRNDSGRVLAIHVEFKRTAEPFEPGQPEGYQLRAPCFARTWKKRSGLNEHHDWITVLICGNDVVETSKAKVFQRAITHDDVRRFMPDYPKEP